MRIQRPTQRNVSIWNHFTTLAMLANQIVNCPWLVKKDVQFSIFRYENAILKWDYLTNLGNLKSYGSKKLMWNYWRFFWWPIRVSGLVICHNQHYAVWCDILCGIGNRSSHREYSTTATSTTYQGSTHVLANIHTVRLEYILPGYRPMKFLLSWWRLCLLTLIPYTMYGLPTSWDG